MTASATPGNYTTLTDVTFLLSAEEEVLIAGGAHLQAVQAFHEDASEPRRSGERPRNLGIKAKRGESSLRTTEESGSGESPGMRRSRGRRRSSRVHGGGLAGTAGEARRAAGKGALSTFPHWRVAAAAEPAPVRTPRRGRRDS